jgi:small subunit ribosomal protein S21
MKNSFIFAPLKKIKKKMLVVNVKENESVEKALKKFKKKFERTGVLRELRDRKQFTKPSVRRRMQMIKARYKQSLNN